MKFRALALDYDGTIAQDGVLDPEVKAAIAEARSRGIVVVLVAGRGLSDLKQLVGSLDFLDAVVAENGAVREFPSRYSRLIGSPPPPAFLDELRRRGVQFQIGQSILDSDAAFAPQILRAIQDLELPLVLLFNRGRLMVLPQGVSKSVGLRHALSALHLSTHNTIAIGDAENDHDLLTACALGVAVAWGSPALKKVADEVLDGAGPVAVAGFIRNVGREMRLPPSRIGRYRIALGVGEDGSAVALSIRGRNVLVSGDPRSGKSWVTGLACEKLILQGYCLCIIDPEGDYRTLESLPGVVVFGGDDPPPQLPDVARTLRHPEMSVVIDLSHVPHKDKIDYLTQDGKHFATPARTLKEFTSILRKCPPRVIDGHVLRGDFSHWIAEVFRDRTLASDVRKAEQRYRLGHIQDLSDSLARVIQARYEFSAEKVA